ncbi:polymer-forming cytoskeletal protein [Fulvivirga sp. 29W222]|uniref:Polymer-forming cytoskeletal protein n=1 Tax=Fulvivirga marina TaxID=2494733 RepID=A0A937FV93_9BACT|nr:polymer-forming cytoskeletal protein [Fulvivirga marina]MBL6446589.1 polymer-forming cytoskeletal protein [Fulvivirga marina]
MFKNHKDNKVSQDLINSNNIIGKGSTFNGNIDTYGNLRVEGRIIGNIRSKSKIAVGQSAVIDGNILAQVAELEGEVKGSVEVTDVLILKPTCSISGDIIANKLVVEAGAKFDGKCKMGTAKSKVDFESKPDDKKSPLKAARNG